MCCYWLIKCTPLRSDVNLRVNGDSGSEAIYQWGNLYFCFLFFFCKSKSSTPNSLLNVLSANNDVKELWIFFDLAQIWNSQIVCVRGQSVTWEHSLTHRKLVGFCSFQILVPFPAFWETAALFSYSTCPPTVQPSCCWYPRPTKVTKHILVTSFVNEEQHSMALQTSRNLGNCKTNQFMLPNIQKAQRLSAPGMLQIGRKPVLWAEKWEIHRKEGAMC